MSGRYRFVIAVLLFVLGMINYMDRAAIGILAPAIKNDLHISASQLGVVFSVFFFVYAFFAFLGGYFADRFGPKLTFGVAVISWSIFCGLTGAVHILPTLLVVRALFGASEGPMNSTTNRMITNWFPRKETARALGFSLSGQNFGSAVAAPIVVYIGYMLGWRMAFAALGMVGIVWSVFWVTLASNKPSENRKVSAAELAHIASDRPKSTVAPLVGDLRAQILRRTTFGLALGLFSLLYPLYIFVSWMPSYFTTLHVTQRGLAIAAGVPWVGGFLGYFLGGFIADFVFARSANGLNARKATTIIPLLIAAGTLACLPIVSSVAGAVVMFTVALFMLSMATQSLWAMIHEVTPAPLMGGVGGFIHFVANMAGVVSPALTGYTIQHGGGYNSAFLIATGVDVAGAVLMWLMIRKDHDYTKTAEVAPAKNLSSVY